MVDFKYLLIILNCQREFSENSNSPWAWAMPQFSALFYTVAFSSISHVFGYAFAGPGHTLGNGLELSKPHNSMLLPTPTIRSYASNGEARSCRAGQAHLVSQKLLQ